MDLYSLIQHKALDELYKRGNYGLMDHFLRDPETAEQLKLKKLQFDVHPELFSDVEDVCQLLDMSKREFLTAATLQAVKLAQEAIEKHGLIPDEETH